MASKTLYVRDTDENTWARAEEFARETRQSLSQVVTGALQRYVPPVPAADDLQEIQVGTGEERARTEAFIGRWLVSPDHPVTQHSRDPDELGYTAWAAAITRRGRIAVYQWHSMDTEQASLDVYASLDEADEYVPDPLIAKAAKALGQERILWRDI
jgi:hypothetical protein